MGESVTVMKPAPMPDEWSRPYWVAAREGRLVMQRCRSCGRAQYPPDMLCRWCQADSFEYTEVNGRGTIYTFGVYTRSFVPAFEAPYVLALVDLDDEPDVRLLCNIVEARIEDVRVGLPVEVVFEARGEWAVPQFRPRVTT